MFDLQIQSKCDERGRSWTKGSSSLSCDSGPFLELKVAPSIVIVDLAASVRPIWGRNQRTSASAAAVTGMQSSCLAFFPPLF